MFSKHLLKVIIGFCGMIIFGLVTLVIVDSFKDKGAVAAVNSPVSQAPVTATPKPPKKAPVKKSTLHSSTTVRVN